MQTYLKLVERYALVVLLALLGVTAFFFLQLPKLTTDSNPYLLPDTHPARKTILEMQQDFTGTFDAALIAIHNRNGVFNRQTLDAVYDMTLASRRMLLVNDADRDQLAALRDKYAAQSPEWKSTVDAILADGLSQNDFKLAESLPALAAKLPLEDAERAFVDFFPRRINPIKELAGMAATENMVVRDGVLVVRPPLVGRGAEPEQVRGEVMGNALQVGGAVSADATVALVVVELYVKQEDAEGQLRAYEAFQKIVDDYRGAHPDFAKANDTHIAGVPIFIAEQKKLVDRDMGTLFPLVIGVVMVVLVLFFRRPLGVILPLTNVVLAAIWTLGLMAVNRAPLDLITSVLPVFLITICGADAIHMLSEYYTQRADGHSAREAARRTMRVMVSPVILTTVTTTAGFLFATMTNISSIRSFGIYMAIGLAFAQLIALLLVPAWLSLFGELGWRRAKTAAAAPARARHEWLGQALERLFRGVIRHRAAYGLGFAALLAGAGFMTTRIHVEDAGSSYFMQDNPFRQADEFVNRHVAGTSPGWIEVSTGMPDGMLTVDKVRFIEAIDTFLAAQPNVTYSYSLSKYIKRLNLVMHDMDLAYDRLPQASETVVSVDPETGERTEAVVKGDDIVAQSVLMYENGGGSDLTNVLNRDFSKAVTMFTMNTTRASEYDALLTALNRWLADNTPPGVQVKLGGTPVIWTGVLDEIIQGQLSSALYALLAVATVLMLWLRSVRQGILATLPLAATMVCYYGFMATFGIDLNIGTAIISFLVVGIVDYSVHYLHRIQIAREEGLALDEALLHAVRHGGQSIVFNVAVFSIGFLTLLMSEFTPIVHLGALVALALSISGAMSLFLITLLAPAFLRGRRTPGTAAVSTAA
ncbi:efflux RND transporter permease subunit [Tahibacter amnicola]|uniref:MMPL family transporter n=1 Tax=Tahibacter amnicola TaxID=2976241 RepID=A0ABY6BGF4_9GAMM|nr:MMPL family transporter [Tahibacter amnicola]UXI69111.1 MMPL family transporter [Tahibacter amnicola]